MFDPVDKISDARKAKPQRLDAGFAVAFSSKEATEHGDSPDDLALVDIIRRGLQGETFVPLGQTFEISRSRPLGHVHAVVRESAQTSRQSDRAHRDASAISGTSVSE